MNLNLCTASQNSNNTDTEFQQSVVSRVLLKREIITSVRSFHLKVLKITQVTLLWNNKINDLHLFQLEH